MHGVHYTDWTEGYNKKNQPYSYIRFDVSKRVVLKKLACIFLSNQNNWLILNILQICVVKQKWNIWHDSTESWVAVCVWALLESTSSNTVIGQLQGNDRGLPILHVLFPCIRETTVIMQNIEILMWMKLLNPTTITITKKFYSGKSVSFLLFTNKMWICAKPTADFPKIRIVWNLYKMTTGHGCKQVVSGTACTLLATGSTGVSPYMQGLFCILLLRLRSTFWFHISKRNDQLEPR